MDEDRHQRLLLLQQTMDAPLLALFGKKLCHFWLEVEDRVGIKKEVHTKILDSGKLGIHPLCDRDKTLIQMLKILSPKVPLGNSGHNQKHNTAKENNTEKRKEKTYEKSARHQFPMFFHTPSFMDGRHLPAV
jgi:hypothetical protein